MSNDEDEKVCKTCGTDLTGDDNDEDEE